MPGPAFSPSENSCSIDLLAFARGVVMADCFVILLLKHRKIQRMNQ